ncbi:MAG TPA: YncE family protein [Bryobacteraceae bacterium]|nr:YncE family protein [Bryobacteraceae bacterium]
MKIRNIAILASILFAFAVRGHAQPSRCNAPLPSPVIGVPLPGRPFMTAITPDGCWIFAGLLGGDNGQARGLAVLRRSGGRVELVRTVSVEGGMGGLVLTHDGKLLVGTNGKGVVLMDIARLTGGKQDPVIGSVDDGPTAGSIYTNVTRDDKLLFVSDESAATITVIDLAKARSSEGGAGAILGKIPVGIAPIALSFSPDERRLYTTSEGVPEDWGWPAVCDPENPNAKGPKHSEGAVIVVDVEHSRSDPAHAVLARVPAGCSPVRLALSPAGDRAYVTARKSNAVLVFDTAALVADAPHALLGTVPVGTAPVPVLVIEGGKKVLAGNSNRFGADASTPQTLSVVDTARIGGGAEAAIGTIATGAFPRDLRLSPDGRTLIVANWGSGSLQLMDVARLPVERGR